nr:hypothetical protein [uncultured Bilophila sp.]
MIGRDGADDDVMQVVHADEAGSRIQRIKNGVHVPALQHFQALAGVRGENGGDLRRRLCEDCQRLGPDGGHALPAQVIKAVDEIGTLEPEEHERKFQIGAGEQKAILRAGGFDDGEHEVRLIFLQGVFP